MSFASEVKNEICKTDITEVCCARAELAGIVCFGASVKGNEIRVRTECEDVAQRFCSLVKFLYNLKADVSVTESGTFMATLSGVEVLKILRDTRLAGVPTRIDREIVRNECCKASMLRGIFLGGGSMTDPEKGYHAELVSNRSAIEKDLRPVFEHFELYPKMINRNGNYVFYIKEGQQIENLLAAIGAHLKMMEFVNVVIEREIKNTTNRRVNFEVANYLKTHDAAVKQQMAIEKIVLEHGWQSMSPELVAVAKLRLEDSDISLAEIAKRLNISKSGVNHRMRKILALAEMEQ